MYSIKKIDVFASEIAEFLGSDLIGRDFVVNYPSSINTFCNKSFLYIGQNETIPENRLKRYKDVLILTKQKIDIHNNHVSYVIVNNPRIQFINVINEFFIENDPVNIAASAKIDNKAKIGNGISIGENTIIGPEVSIGNNTKILNNVVITGCVKIGSNCLIKHNSTIGSVGYDFEVDEGNNLIHFPHVGKISIGNDVWIGANTCIENPAIDQTVIEDNVKIDDLVQIGANSIIRKGTMITAGVIISRQVVVGKNCLIAPNVSVRDAVEIGNQVTVGIGSVVVKNLRKNGTYVGNPARMLKK